jgi:hypothetical protein
VEYGAHYGTKLGSVVNNAHEFLRPDSLLSKSILSLATMGSTYSVLLISRSPLSVDPRFISLSDYMVRGYPNPRSWADYCRLHTSYGSPSLEETQLHAGQFIITPRRTVVVCATHQSDELIGSESGSIIMDVEELNNISCQEDSYSSLHITGPKKENAILESDPQDDIGRRQEFEQKLDFDTLDRSMMSPNQAPSVHSHSSSGDLLDLHQNQTSVEPNGNIESHYLLPLLMSLMKSHSEVISSNSSRMANGANEI